MTPGPPSSAQLEQQFQERIARAKEAARLASIAAAARSNPAGFNGVSAVPGVPMRPPPVTTTSRTATGPFPVERVPADVRNRIDRLVEFVARNGEAFEATAKLRERDNPDFQFLKPGGPHADYYEWKKQQVCGASVSPGAFAPPRAGSVDLMSGMAVGAMANVCRLAKARGVPAYAPIPTEIVMNVGTLPPVEPARLEIRLDEFYREEEERRRADA